MPEVVVFCTCGKSEEASELADALVKARLAACVNMLPPITSVYRWHDQVEKAEEVLLIIKTTSERFGALRDRILQIHTYETPEIIAIPIVDASAPYLQWLREQV